MIPSYNYDQIGGVPVAIPLIDPAVGQLNSWIKGYAKMAYSKLSELSGEDDGVDKVAGVHDVPAQLVNSVQAGFKAVQAYLKILSLFGKKATYVTFRTAGKAVKTATKGAKMTTTEWLDTFGIIDPTFITENLDPAPADILHDSAIKNIVKGEEMMDAFSKFLFDYKRKETSWDDVVAGKNHRNFLPKADRAIEDFTDAFVDSTQCATNSSLGCHDTTNAVMHFLMEDGRNSLGTDEEFILSNLTIDASLFGSEEEHYLSFTGGGHALEFTVHIDDNLSS